MKTLNTSYQPMISLRKTAAFGSYIWVNSFFRLFSVFRAANGATYLSLFILLVSLSSCGNKNAEDIEKELSSRVVLIQNKSYYEAKLSNGNSLYFTSFDKESGIIGLTADVDSVDMSISYGTGFFISSDGKIVTNHHVVADKVENQEITKSI